MKFIYDSCFLGAYTAGRKLQSGFENNLLAAAGVHEFGNAKEHRMEINPTPFASDVLHSEKHTKLTAEEIAKAVARHNKHHPHDKVQNVGAKAKKANTAKK